jgi:uncharacterized protein (TIGR00730 family)
MEKHYFSESLHDGHFRVAIFGSARIKRQDPGYKLIYGLSKLIAADGIDIVTGGGPGTMEAANKGHQEGRGGNHIHSYGLSIKLPKGQTVNRHLDIKREFRKFSRRLDCFMSLSNAVVVAPGGVGTMLELLYTWQLVQVEKISDMPIILLGKMWPEFLKWVKKWQLKHKLVDKVDMRDIYLAKTPAHAMKIIKKAHKEFENLKT